MKFCPDCAAPIISKIPVDDNRLRYVCSQCETIHYQNPKLVVGTIPIWMEDDKIQVLLCKRAIEPRYGFWTLPAGFMENGESTSQAALRETHEEAGANIELHSLYTVMNVPHVDQVHLFYRATLLDFNFNPGIESLEVKLFNEEDIPWNDIAFRTVAHSLRYFFEDHKKRNAFPLHELDIVHSSTTK